MEIIKKSQENYPKCKSNCLHHLGYMGLKDKKCSYKLITAKPEILEKILEVRCTDFTNYKKKKKLGFFDILDYFG